MSYRTYVNDVQIFGNNEAYDKWLGFIRSEGIEVDEDGCYCGEIHNVNKAIKVLEEIILDMDKYRLKQRAPWMGKFISDDLAYLVPKSIFDFTNLPERVYKLDKNGEPLDYLTDKLMELYKNAYMFLPVQFIMAIKDKCERGEADNDKTDHWRFYKYKIKDGEHIKVYAG